MNRKLLAIFFIGGIAAASDCNRNVKKLENKIHNKFSELWKSADDAVGIDFFMTSLRANNRMPASEQSSSDYYQKLLAGMTRTSKEMKYHGLKFSEKTVQDIKKLISEYKLQQSCVQISKN